MQYEMQYEMMIQYFKRLERSGRFFTYYNTPRAFDGSGV